ncbi:MAG TPA: hypothetical protein VJ853_12025 [Thermoanaerobaculia bacterium]|nr:hypothetical protein [Thermoanaerobaculia bacterium]
MIRRPWILLGLLLVFSSAAKKPDCLETCITKTAVPCYDKCLAAVTACEKAAKAKCKEDKACLDAALAECEKDADSCDHACGLELDKCVRECWPHVSASPGA